MISIKNLKKFKIGILLGCLFYFIFASQIHLPLIDKSNNKTESKVKISLDPIYNLTGTTIYIDNTDPSNDWATNEATYAWCTGDGSSLDPYTISQVLIDGPYTDLITIKNSDIYFSITLCDLFGGARGIYLDNVTNGEIQYNNCSRGAKGIALYDCDYNTISNNYFRDNIHYGIESTICSFNDINSNNFLESENGIKISDGFSNKIDNNTISVSNSRGIYLWKCLYTNITRNVLDNSDHSVFCGYSDHNYIAHNEIFDTRFGISLDFESDHNTAYNNTIHDITNLDSCGVCVSGDYNNISENIIEYCRGGIYSYGNYNNISENTIERCYEGIYLSGNFSTISDNLIDTTNESGIIVESCSNFSVKGNVITNVSEFGVSLINSESGDIVENLLYDCGFNVDGDPSLMSNLNLDDSNQVNGKPVYFHEGITGLNNDDVMNAGQIILYSCDLGDFSTLDLNHCTLGMALYYCDSTSISDSEFTYNNHSGIFVKSSNYTTITNINALNNGNGIFLEDSKTKTNITNNLISYNRHSGVYISSSENFLIKNNQIERNEVFGVYLTESSSNNLLSNTVRYNVVAGIYLYESSNNSISANTASYNGNFGIRLAHYSDENNITKNTLTSNYNTTTSFDYTSTGLEIYECAYNFISENNIRDHRESINIEWSFNIDITKNALYDGINIQRSTNLTFSKNALSVGATSTILLIHTTNSMFIENELSRTCFFIKYDSNYNSFIGNVLLDSAIAFYFEDSSYNVVINNSIYRAGQCFRETGTCIGNVFEGNYCQEGIILPPLDIFSALIGSISVAGVAVFMYLKRRKYMR